MLLRDARGYQHDRSPEEIQEKLALTATGQTKKAQLKAARDAEIMGGGADPFADPSFGEAKESQFHRDISELSREVNRNIALLDKKLHQVEKKKDENLKARMWEISETDRLEEKRARQLKNNHELKENFQVEVDNLMAHQQYAKASKLYGKKQVELSVPDWFRTLDEMVKNTRSTGHSDKLRWRSKACAYLKRCILESEDDKDAVQSRISMRDLALKINHHNAAALISRAERIKEAYVDYCQLNDTRFGKSSRLMRESDAQIDRTSVVPLVRTDWSEKLDDADSERKRTALGDTDSWSTVSRPVTLTPSEVSSLFEGGAQKLVPFVQEDLPHGGTSPLVQIEGMEGATLLNQNLIKEAPPPLPMKTVPDRAKAGAMKPGGDKYQVHPPGLNQAQTQAVLRMRTAAAMGNYELTRSIFVNNYDTPHAIKEKKMKVGRSPPTMDVFRIMMVAFKNAPELRFEDAFETFDLVESYGLIPDTSLYNIMMRACEKESRWRRAIAMYKDLLHVHNQLPNVQTFDILVDCCRHSLEEPKVIFEELRKLDLPRDYCYKAALANAGNRIPEQVLYETMHDVSNAPLPTDGRFERNVKKDKDAAMRLHGLLPPPDKERLAHYWHKSKTKATEYVGLNKKAGQPAFEEDNSTILSYEETHSLGGADDGRNRVDASDSSTSITAARGGESTKTRQGRTILKDSSLSVPDHSMGGLGTHGTDNLNYASQSQENVSPVMNGDGDGRDGPPNAYVAAALTLTLGGDMDKSVMSTGGGSLTAENGGGGNLHVLSQMVDSLDREEQEAAERVITDAVVTGQLLNDKVDAYQWSKLTNNLKNLLPKQSTVKTRGFGSMSEPFTTQVYRSLPHEGYERKQMVQKSVSFMKSLNLTEQKQDGEGQLGGSLSSISGAGMTMMQSSVAVGEAAFSPSQSLEFTGPGATFTSQGTSNIAADGAKNETAFLNDVVGAWKEKQDGKHHNHDALLDHHFHKLQHKEGQGQGQGQGQDDKMVTEVLPTQELDIEERKEDSLEELTIGIDTVSYLDNEGSTVHYHEGLELEKHQYTVPYKSISPSQIEPLPDGSPSHEQVLASLGRWKEARTLESEEEALVEQAGIPIPRDSMSKVFGITSDTSTVEGEEFEAGAKQRMSMSISTATGMGTDTGTGRARSEKKRPTVASSRFAYSKDKDLKERREKKAIALRAAEELEETRSMAASILSERTDLLREMVDDDGTVHSYHSKEAQMDAALQARAAMDAKRPFRTRTYQPMQKKLLKMPQDKTLLMKNISETIVHGGDGPALRYKQRMRQKGT